MTFAPISDFLLEGLETFSLELSGTTMYPEGDWKGERIEISIIDTSVPTPIFN